MSTRAAVDIKTYPRDASGRTPPRPAESNAALAESRSVSMATGTMSTVEAQMRL
jgi:hypothetical protein